MQKPGFLAEMFSERPRYGLADAPPALTCPFARSPNTSDNAPSGSLQFLSGADRKHEQPSGFSRRYFPARRYVRELAHPISPTGIKLIDYLL
jgi:hypothetical protein